MEQLKLAISIKENGKNQSLEIELNRTEGGLHKPIIRAEDSANGFKTVTELPAKNYSRLVQNLGGMVAKHAADPSKIAKTILNIFSFISEGAVG